MADTLAANPLLLLFVVAAIGYLVGRIELCGTKLGVAAVLFVGLGFGAWDARLQLPEVVQSFGLVLFVYSVGLSCGPGFAAMIRGKGWRQSCLVAAMIMFAAGLTLALDLLCSLGPASSAGLFAGALTNTPALAAVTELIKNRAALAGAASTDAAAVVAYSIAYPVGVLGVIAAYALAKRLWAGASAAQPGRTDSLLNRRLVGHTLHVTNANATKRPLGVLLAAEGLDVIAGRKRSLGVVATVHDGETLVLGDLFTIVGSEAEVRRAATFFGEVSPIRLEDDRSLVDFRRILVSNPKLAGRSLDELKLEHKFAAVVTRLRRGDVDLLPNPRMVLELGDRLRVVGSPRDLKLVSSYLGDSERKVSEFDVISLGLGIAMGLVLGMVSLPMPGGLSLRLGVAGGPMVVALILGARSRTGPVLWSLPHGANLTLRQLGLLLFLACVGIRAGRPFFETLNHGEYGWRLFLAGAFITCSTSMTTLWLGHRCLKIPLNTLYGVVGGLQTQPALLAYAQEQPGGEQAGIGYAEVFPLAFIIKVVFAQVIFLWLAA